LRRGLRAFGGGASFFFDWIYMTTIDDNGGSSSDSNESNTVAIKKRCASDLLVALPDNRQVAASTAMVCKGAYSLI
jgi:hypothetical protein